METKVLRSLCHLRHQPLPPSRPSSDHWPWVHAGKQQFDPGICESHIPMFIREWEYLISSSVRGETWISKLMRILCRPLDDRCRALDITANAIGYVLSATFAGPFIELYIYIRLNWLSNLIISIIAFTVLRIYAILERSISAAIILATVNTLFLVATIVCPLLPLSSYLSFRVLMSVTRSSSLHSSTMSLFVSSYLTWLVLTQLRSLVMVMTNSLGEFLFIRSEYRSSFNVVAFFLQMQVQFLDCTVGLGTMRLTRFFILFYQGMSL